MKRTVILRDGTPVPAEVSQIQKGAGVATSDIGRYMAVSPSGELGIGDSAEEACDSLGSGQVEARPTKRGR